MKALHVPLRGTRLCLELARLKVSNAMEASPVGKRNAIPPAVTAEVLRISGLESAYTVHGSVGRVAENVRMTKIVATAKPFGWVLAPWRQKSFASISARQSSSWGS